jgi:hypothetical protein
MIFRPEAILKRTQHGGQSTRTQLAGSTRARRERRQLDLLGGRHSAILPEKRARERAKVTTLIALLILTFIVDVLSTAARRAIR